MPCSTVLSWSGALSHCSVLVWCLVPLFCPGQVPCPIFVFWLGGLYIVLFWSYSIVCMCLCSCVLHSEGYNVTFPPIVLCQVDSNTMILKIVIVIASLLVLVNASAHYNKSTHFSLCYIKVFMLDIILVFPWMYITFSSLINTIIMYFCLYYHMPFEW